MTYIEDDEGLDDVSVGLQMQQFLDEWHYRIVHSSMAANWDRSACITKVLELFEAMGMRFTPEETEYLSAADLPEDQLIEGVVKKMPREQRVTFEHFTLQLQLIVSTATRVRMALEEGTGDEVRRIVEEGDTGITQQILKQVCIEAASEVGELKDVHDSWKKSMVKRVERLSKAAQATEEARALRDDLQDALGAFSSTQSDKSKKVLMSLAGNSDKLLVKSIFNTWQAYFYKYTAEKDIHDKFRAEIQNAEVKLMEYKQAKLGSTRAVLIGGAEAGERALILEVFKGWSKETANAKEEKALADDIAQAQAKLSNMQSAQKDKAKASMMRIGMGNDVTLKTFILQGWQQCAAENKKTREWEAAQQEAADKLREAMSQKSDQAREVVARMVGASATGLLFSVMSEWAHLYKEEKKDRERAKELEKDLARFKGLNDRQKANGMGRAHSNIELEQDLLVMTCFMNWHTEATTERLHKYYAGQMANKKGQLEAVQSMFKSFATQLEGMSSTPRSQRRSQRGGSTSQTRSSGPVA